MSVLAMHWFFANGLFATFVVFLMAVVLYHNVGRGSPRDYEQLRFLRTRVASRALTLVFSFFLGLVLLFSIEPEYACECLCTLW